MTTDAAGDAAWCALHGLRGLEPDAARAQRVRERCGSLMRRRRRRAERRSSFGDVTLGLLERVLVGILCGSYLLALGHEAFRWYSDH